MYKDQNALMFLHPLDFFVVPLPIIGVFISVLENFQWRTTVFLVAI